MTKYLLWITNITLTEKQLIFKCFDMVHRCCEQNSVSENFCCCGKVDTMATNSNLLSSVN